VNVASVSVPTDAASIEHGKHLATILCMECHAKDLGGTPNWFELGPMGGANTPNLTTGKGGLGSQLTDEDLMRVLRNGVKPDGTSVFVMPAQDFYYMSDRDLGDLIAYIRSVPPVDREASSAQLHFTFLGGTIYGAGVFGNQLRASEIDQVNRPVVPRTRCKRRLWTLPCEHQRMSRLPRSATGRRKAGRPEFALSTQPHTGRRITRLDGDRFYPNTTDRGYTFGNTSSRPIHALDVQEPDDRRRTQSHLDVSAVIACATVIHSTC
jgi:mono/diheme cytochrome c family protein